MDCNVTPTMKPATRSDAVKEGTPSLTPEQRTYLTFRHMRELKSANENLATAKSELRRVKRKMAGKPCQSAVRCREPLPCPEPLPSWVPDDVQWLVTSHWGDQSGSPQQTALVQRLLTDLRMETVWQKLLQKRRLTGEYFYLPDNLKGALGSTRANEVYPASTAVVFQRAVVVGQSALRIAEQKRSHYLEQARGLRSDARFLRRMIKERRLGNVPTDDVHRLASQIDGAAGAYERLDQLAGSGLFENSRLAAKGFAVEMMKTMQGLYKTPMYGTIEILARVALKNDEITRVAVREWCVP
jgi:hypothetical protein